MMFTFPGVAQELGFTFLQCIADRVNALDFPKQKMFGLVMEVNAGCFWIKRFFSYLTGILCSYQILDFKLIKPKIRLMFPGANWAPMYSKLTIAC